jgi:hypothetical protein
MFVCLQGWQTASQQQAVQQQAAESARGEWQDTQHQQNSQLLGQRDMPECHPGLGSAVHRHSPCPTSFLGLCLVVHTAHLPAYLECSLASICAACACAVAAAAVRRRGLLWKIPFTLLSLGLAAAGGYYGWQQWEEHKDKEKKEGKKDSSSKTAAAKK